MESKEIEIGGRYKAKVSNRIVTVRIDAIREDSDGKRRYDVINLVTGRALTFRSAAKFRSLVIDSLSSWRHISPAEARYNGPGYGMSDDNR